MDLGPSDDLGGLRCTEAIHANRGANAGMLPSCRSAMTICDNSVEIGELLHRDKMQERLRHPGLP